MHHYTGYYQQLHHICSWACGEFSGQLTPESFCLWWESVGQNSHIYTLPHSNKHIYNFPSSETHVSSPPAHPHLSLHFKKKMPYQPRQKLLVQGNTVISSSRARLLLGWWKVIVVFAIFFNLLNNNYFCTNLISSWIKMLGSSNCLCSQKTVFIFISGGEIGRRHEKLYQIPTEWYRSGEETPSIAPWRKERGLMSCRYRVTIPGLISKGTLYPRVESPQIVISQSLEIFKHRAYLKGFSIIEAIPSLR